MQVDPKEQEHNFNTFSDELEHIQEQVTQNEKELGAPPSPEHREVNISEEVQRYKEKPTSEVLHPDFQMQVDEIEAELGGLSPEQDKQLDELVAIMAQKGLKNTLAVLERLGNFHVNDDFHRFLIQYIAKGLEVKGLKEGTPMFKALNMRLFEVTLPDMGGDKSQGSFSELVRAMEQFYVGMMSLKDNDKVMNHFTIELALSNHSDDLVFYAAIPSVRAQLFEKQLMASFPKAALSERKEDYNPFNEEGVTVGSIAELADHRGFPLKTFEEFDQDPLNVILGTFSKLNKVGEGAAIQLSIAPSGNDVNNDFKTALDRMKDGEVLSRAFEGTGKRVTREIFSLAGDIFKTQSPKKDEPEKIPEVNQEAIDKISHKIQHPILRTNLRIIASSGTKTRAEQILGELESSFNQFSKQQSNEFIFKRRGGARLKELLHNFSFRLFNEDEELVLNTQELTTMMHFPVTHLSTPELKSATLMTAAAPVSMPEDGVLLGINNHRGTKTEVRMGGEDRVRHMYVIGQTGTGKTVLLKNMIIQDILNGDGVCYMDPHGTDIEDILNAIPEERMDDVIYFDPSDMERPMGLNMLEYDVTKPEQKAFVVNEMLSIFNKLFDMKTAGGPMFEQYFRNATMLVIEDPDSGNTLIEIVRVLANEEFRKLKLSKCKNQIVKQFWEEIAGKAGGESSLANMVPYITNKFDVFLSNDIMRLIVAQEKSSFNIREVMDNRKILLVNLAKGRLGDINSHLIGLILVGKILMAALGRVDNLGNKPADFYLYIDEFQNVTTDSISAILSEARKYRLSLTIAHQFIAQLPEDIKGAVFGNVGSKAAFRISSEDAQFLETQFAPEFAATDIMKIPNYNAYVSMLVNGFPAKPFNMATIAPQEGIDGRGEQIKQLSKQKYGRDRAELEALVERKFAEMKSTAAPTPSARPGAGPAPQGAPGQAAQSRKLTPEEQKFIMQLRRKKLEEAAATRQAAPPVPPQQVPQPPVQQPQPVQPPVQQAVAVGAVSQTATPSQQPSVPPVLPVAQPITAPPVSVPPQAPPVQPAPALAPEPRAAVVQEPSPVTAPEPISAAPDPYHEPVPANPVPPSTVSPQAPVITTPTHDADVEPAPQPAPTAPLSQAPTPAPAAAVAPTPPAPQTAAPASTEPPTGPAAPDPYREAIE